MGVARMRLPTLRRPSIPADRGHATVDPSTFPASASSRKRGAGFRKTMMLKQDRSAVSWNRFPGRRATVQFGFRSVRGAVTAGTRLLLGSDDRDGRPVIPVPPRGPGVRGGHGFFGAVRHPVQQPCPSGGRPHRHRTGQIRRTRCPSPIRPVPRTGCRRRGRNSASIRRHRSTGPADGRRHPRGAHHRTSGRRRNRRRARHRRRRNHRRRG